MSQRTADGFRQFVYQGPDMLKLQLERDESEETVAHYTIGAGLEAMRRETSSFYHYNHLGTALALTGADEAVSDTYRHDAWGVLLERTGSTVNPHTWVGRERYYRMPNAAMYHLGFRDYAQGLGRFMTVDPAMSHLMRSARMPNRPQPTVHPQPLRVDPYGLVGNRPAVAVDPSGLFWQWVLVGVVIGGVLVYVWIKIWADDDPVKDLIADGIGNMIDQIDECPTQCPTAGPLLDAIDAAAAINNREQVAQTCNEAMGEICTAKRQNQAGLYGTVLAACAECCMAIVDNLPGYTVPYQFCSASCHVVADEAESGGD